MKKVRFNGYETEAPVNLEAVYENVRMRAPDEFVEHVAGAMAHMNAAIEVKCGEMTMRDAAFAFNRSIRIIAAMDKMLSTLRDFR